MKIYRLERTQKLPISLEKAWDFFSTPLNLNEITPEDMKFEILSNIKKTDKMFEGMIINYKVSPFPLVKLRWTTEITHVEELKYFVDEQRFGPYAFWHHKHFFEKIDSKHVMMTDIVDYGIPFGFVGRIANSILIESKLNEIFDFRYRKLESHFGNSKLIIPKPKLKAI